MHEIPTFTHTYVVKKPCGCCVAWVGDLGDNDTARDIAHYIRKGYSVDRVPREQLSAWPTPMGCTCQKVVQEVMF